MKVERSEFKNGKHKYLDFLYIEETENRVSKEGTAQKII